jgi:hypothetical protein
MGPRAIDKSVNALLQGCYIAGVFSLASMYKNNPFNLVTARDKFGFLFRNIFVFASICCANVYIVEILKNKFSKNNKDNDGKKNILGEKYFSNFFISFFGAIFPSYLGYKLYFFRNKKIHFEKSLFVVAGLTFFLTDFFGKK